MGFVEALAAWAVFLVLTIASSRLGALAPKVGLPLITGFLFVGSLAGPYVLGIITKPMVPILSYTTKFALAFIAFSAGAELYLPELRSLFKRILYSTTSIALITFAICTPVIILISRAGVIPFMAGLEPGCGSAVAAIAASIMTARSPASAIAVVKETKARGTFTSSLLGITVLSDVFVLIGFTLTTNIAETQCNGEGFSIASLGIMLATLIGDVLVGYLIGKLLIVLMLFKRIPARYLILPLGLGIFLLTDWFADYSEEKWEVGVKFEPLMICIVAGYICTNQSAHRNRFLAVLQQAGPYVFLPFFTFTGASLDLGVMLKAIGFAAIMVLARGASIFFGSAAGGWLAGQSKQHNLHMWMTLLTQAGVSLGLAAEVGMSFPEWGRAFQTSIIAVVLVNQIVGPVLFKIAIRRVGEAGKGSSEEGFDEDATIPTALVVGYSPDSLALATRLLKEHWNVTLLAATPVQAADAREAIGAYFREERAAAQRAQGALQSLVSGVKTSLLTLGDKAVAVAVNAGHAHSSQPITEQQEAWATVGAVGDASPSPSPSSTASSATAASGVGWADFAPAVGSGAGSGAADKAPLAAGGKAGTAAPASAAAAKPAAVEDHGHGHEHGEARHLEKGFTTLFLQPDEIENPFLPGGVTLAALATMQATLTTDTAAAAAYGASSSGSATPAHDPDFQAVGVGGSGAGSTASAFRYTALVAAIRSTRTLQAVACMLPTDLCAYAACEVVRAVLDSAPKRSHLHSVRVLSRVHNPAWGPLFEQGPRAVPFDPFSGSAVLAAKVATASLGKPIAVLKPQATDKDLVGAVGAWAGASVHQWSFEAAWREGFRKECPEPPVELVAKIEAHSKALLERNTQVGGASSTLFASLKDRVGGVGVAGEEVPEWQRGEYIDSLSRLQDEGTWNLHSSNMDARTQKLEDMGMFGSVMGHDEEQGGGAGEGATPRARAR